MLQLRLQVTHSAADEITGNYPFQMTLQRDRKCLPMVVSECYEELAGGRRGDLGDRQDRKSRQKG